MVNFILFTFVLLVLLIILHLREVYLHTLTVVGWFSQFEPNDILLLRVLHLMVIFCFTCCQWENRANHAKSMRLPEKHH